MGNNMRNGNYSTKPSLNQVTLPLTKLFEIATVSIHQNQTRSDSCKI